MNLLPFDSVKVCQACGRDIKSPKVKYGTERKMAVGNGQFVLAGEFGVDRPHLEKHCETCGYGWLEETAPPGYSGSKFVGVTAFGSSQVYVQRHTDAVGTTGCKATIETKQ